MAPRTLRGMRVAITGASAGIGAALARALAHEGALLALGARRLEPLQQLCRELGPGHAALCVDVSAPAQCQDFISAASQHLGGIDTLVCNAGYGMAADVEETTLAQWDAIWRTNLLGTTSCIVAALPALRANALRQGWRDQVLIVSSALARRGKPGASAYCATKAAQLSVAEALRLELAAERIGVTSVHPVNTATEFIQVVASHGRAWPRSASDPAQSAEQVAAAILRGIRRPRPEIWPHRPTRWMLALAAWMPGTVDRLLARRLRRP